MNKSGLFGEISTEQANPDIQLTMTLHKVVEDVDGSFWLLSLAGTYRFHMKAIVSESSSGEQSAIELEDQTEALISIFAIPLMPFKFPSYELRKFENKFFDNLCIEIYKTGMLEE